MFLELDQFSSLPRTSKQGFSPFNLCISSILVQDLELGSQSFADLPVPCLPPIPQSSSPPNPHYCYNGFFHATCKTKYITKNSPEFNYSIHYVPGFHMKTTHFFPTKSMNKKINYVLTLPNKRI